MNDLHAPRRRAPAFRGHRAGPAADEDDEVRLVDDCAGRRDAAVRSDDAEMIDMTVGQAALTADRGRDDDVQSFRHGLQGRLSAGENNTAAADDDRVAGRKDGVRRRLDRLGVGRTRPGRKGLEIGLGPDIAVIDGRFLNIERQSQMRRPGASRGHRPKGRPHHAGQSCRVLDDAVPLGQGTKQSRLVELRQRITSPRRDRYVRGDRQQRDRRFVRLDDARQNMGGAAAARPLADTDAPGDARIGIRHVGRATLIAGQDMLHAVIETEKGIIERQGGVPAQAEDMLHAVGLEQAHHGLGAIQGIASGLRHRYCPVISRNEYISVYSSYGECLYE